jgi:tRNA-Thr(GGU) m(6)t(6)A37 methyltransferase TsaA
MNKPKNLMPNFFVMNPIGYIRKTGDKVIIEILSDYQDALLGLEGFSHIIVFSWFHVNDTAEKRKTLRVHPRGNRTNPLTGVFATRSPVRPNPIAISTCKILSIKKNKIQIDRIDSFDNTPVIDIKPLLHSEEPGHEFRVPDWIKKK